MDELSRIGPELMGDFLEDLDRRLFEGRPSWMRPVRTGKRRIPTLSGHVEFKRRYYYDGREREYTYWLDSVPGIPEYGKPSNAFGLRLATMADDMAYSKTRKWSPLWGSGMVSRPTMLRCLRDLCMIAEDGPLEEGLGKIHVMTDEKYAKIFGKRNKSRVHAASIFRRKRDGRLLARTF